MEDLIEVLNKIRDETFDKIYNIWLNHTELGKFHKETPSERSFEFGKAWTIEWMQRFADVMELVVKNPYQGR